MCRVACTRKEASCILGNLFRELDPPCDSCQSRREDELLLVSADGLTLSGVDRALIRGHCALTGAEIAARLTDYGFEFFGDFAQIQQIRKARCVRFGGTVYPSEEG